MKIFLIAILLLIYIGINAWMLFLILDTELPFHDSTKIDDDLALLGRLNIYGFSIITGFIIVLILHLI